VKSLLSVSLDPTNIFGEPMSLATKLKHLREKRGQSQQKLADALGVSRVYIWKLEKGSKKNPSLDLLMRLAEHFKVSIAYFQDDMNVPEDNEALQFFRDFQGKLSKKAWKALRGMAEAMKSNDSE